MLLPRHFSHVKTKDGLPDHSCSESMSSSIEEANKEVSIQLALIDDDGKKSCNAMLI